MKPVLKILKEGETDVHSMDISKFAFHSEYPVFKIATAGNQNATIVANGTETYIDIPHNLGYKPIFLAFLKYANITSPIFGEGDSGLYGVGILDIYDLDATIIVYTELSETNLRIGLYTPFDPLKSNTTFNISWIIMLDEF